MRKEVTVRRLCILATLSALGLVLAVPSGAVAAGSIGALSLLPDTVRAGESSQGTVDLAFPDPEPTVVRLFSFDTSVATVPVSVTVPAEATTATFTVTTNAAAPPTIVQIMAATPDNVSRTQNLSVNAATPAGPSLTSVSLVPTSIVGGANATGTVRFSGAMNDGAVVQLFSSNPAVAQVPSETVVNARASSGAFNLSTSPVSANTTVTITARWFGVSQTTTITVKPGAPPAPDVVKIKKASWKKGLLTIEATSTNPNAILSVHSRSGAFMFTLTNNGGGRYSDQRGWITNPMQVTVRSNFGGSATASTK